MVLQESGEMYLETIYILSQRNDHVRSLDIATHMNFSKPSVSRAVHILQNNAYINIDGNGYITLTATGSEIARKIYERHLVLSALLRNLGVDDDTATEDACRIEHVISDTSFDAIKRHVARYRPDFEPV